MSYILDALRRADAEREQAAVPGIHSLNNPRMAGDGPKRSAAGNPLVWVIVGLSVVLVAALIWISLAQGESAPVPPRVEAVAATLAVQAVAPASTVAAVIEPRPLPPLIVAEPAPLPRPAARKPASSAVRVAARPASAPKADAVEEMRVPPMSELPDQIRGELPTLSVGGAMYSQKKANRMLIVNGQLLHEGDKPAPGVTLEQIRLKSAVLEYKGQRYSISY